MIDLDRDGAIFVLRMNAGENRLAPAFLEDYERALDQVESASGQTALVTTGHGRFYSNGLDVAALAEAEPNAVVQFLGRLHGLFARLLSFDVPTVAALNGHAFAGGAMLAVAHDSRVMRSDRGYFCLPEIDLATGRALTRGMFALLQARLAPATLHEALVTGRRFTAPSALVAGLVDESCAERDVLPRAIERARALARRDRATLGALKRGLYAEALAALRHSEPGTAS